MSNLQWAHALIPDQPTWIHETIAYELDYRDEMITQLRKSIANHHSKALANILQDCEEDPMVRESLRSLLTRIAGLLK